MIERNPNQPEEKTTPPTTAFPNRMQTVETGEACETTLPKAAGATAGDSSQSVQSMADQAKQRGRETVSQVREQAAAVGRDVREQAGQAAGQLKDQGRTMAMQQKDRVADDIGGVGEAIRQAAGRLHEEEDHTLAQYTEALADQVQRVSGYLKNRDLGGLIDDCEDLARRRPELLIGGMFITGLAVGRFLKASRRPGSRQFGEHHQTSARDEIEYGRPAVGTQSFEAPSGFTPQYGTHGDARRPGATAPPSTTYEGTLASPAGTTPAVTTPAYGTPPPQPSAETPIPNKPR